MAGPPSPSRKPDDWHLHVRDGAMLKAALPFTAAHFGRAIIMPNLLPPVLTVKDAVAYRKRLMAALPEGSTFQPLMTCYLTDSTDPDDVETGFREGVFTAVKMYILANATTNPAYGVTDFQVKRVHPDACVAQKHGKDRHDLRLIHGEEADPDIDVFDREGVFIERRLIPMTKDFPGLFIVLEHLSSREGVDFVRAHAPHVGGSITPYHLMLTRTDWLGYGNRPYMYCMPVIKRREDRDAHCVRPRPSGDSHFFLGTTILRPILLDEKS